MFLLKSENIRTQITSCLPTRDSMKWPIIYLHPRVKWYVPCYPNLQLFCDGIVDSRQGFTNMKMCVLGVMQYCASEDATPDLYHPQQECNNRNVKFSQVSVSHSVHRGRVYVPCLGVGYRSHVWQWVWYCQLLG